MRQDSSLHPPPPLLACWRMKTHRSIIGLAMMRRGAQHWSAVALLWRMVGWPPTRDGLQSSVSSLAKQSLRKRYSPILRSGYFAQLYLIFINSNITHLEVMVNMSVAQAISDPNHYKNGHILPTGQWYAPSAVINDAWYWMVMHGISWYHMVLHGIGWYCMVLHGITLYCIVLQGIA